MMNFRFVELYSEIDTSFDVTNATLIPLRFFLDSLGKKMPHYDKLFKGDKYTFILFILATRLNASLQIKGPRTLSKHREVEFFVDIPYRKFDNYADEMDYILDNVAQGIIFALKKYKTDPSGVQEVINILREMIKQNPEKYNGYPKDVALAQGEVEEMVKANPDKFRHLFPDLFPAKS